VAFPERLKSEQEETDMRNSETVQAIHAAFGRGDIPSILSRLSEDVQWEYGVSSTDVPWLQPRSGRADVAKFFEALAAVEFSRFQPKTVLENGPIAVSLVDVEATVKATGRRVVEEDEVHIWHFDEHGPVSRFRHRVDTHQHLVAHKGLQALD
jgi:ketosteroid isomerase-like protein